MDGSRFCRILLADARAGIKKPKNILYLFGFFLGGEAVGQRKQPLMPVYFFSAALLKSCCKRPHLTSNLRWHVWPLVVADLGKTVMLNLTWAQPACVFGVYLLRRAATIKTSGAFWEELPSAWSAVPSAFNPAANFMANFHPFASFERHDFDEHWIY